MLRESSIERTVVSRAKDAGWLSYKFVSPSNSGVPDRIFIKAGRVVFIEFKAPGKKPTKLQEKIIGKIREAGVEVYVCDNVEDACNALQI